MELEVFDGWTIDRRLKQLRKIDENDKILFVDFDSELGDLIFQKKILIDEINDSLNADEFIGKVDEFFEFVREKNQEIFEVNKVIKKLEKELK